MKTRRKTFETIAVVGGLAAYVIGSEIYYARSISPKGISTVQEFFDRFGEPSYINMVRCDGQGYYEFIGHLPSFWSTVVPSAPPAYVFDVQGRFVTWCSDPGDIPSYHKKWQRQSTNQVEMGLVKEKFGLR